MVLKSCGSETIDRSRIYIDTKLGSFQPVFKIVFESLTRVATNEKAPHTLAHINKQDI